MYLQDTRSIPLLHNLKEQFTNFPFEKGYYSSLVVGIHMLLESGRSYLWGGHATPKNVPNPRIRALSFGKEVEKAFGTLWEWLERETYANIVTLSPPTEQIIMRSRSILQEFVAEERFDLFAQSPWVAGSAVSAIADLSLDTGVELLNEGAFMSCVLHMYNMLRQIGVAIPKIPILEHLAGRFPQPVFAGTQRPIKSFHGRSLLSCGAKNDHYKGAKEWGFNALVNDRKKDATQIYSPHRKIRLATMSRSATTSFWNNYVPSPELWDELTGVSDTAGKCNIRHNVLGVFERHSISDMVLRAKDIAMSDYEGIIPLARLNCSAVLQLCLDIHKDIAIHACAPGYSAFPEDCKKTFGIKLADTFDLENKSPENGVSFVKTFMLYVDVITACARSTPQFGKLYKNLHKYPPLLIMRDAIVKACKGKEVKDFLWKEI
jgi:hypothetical protein